MLRQGVCQVLRQEVSQVLRQVLRQGVRPVLLQVRAGGGEHCIFPTLPAGTVCAFLLAFL